MRNLTKAFTAAVTLARRANDASLTEAERATATTRLAASVAKHKLALADVITAATASDPASQHPLTPTQAIAVATAIAKRVAKPSSKAAPKPDAKRDAIDAERARAQANRAATMRHYAGASQASHATRAPKLADALARVASPIQRAKSPSPRDESALALALSHADKSNTFCPVAGTFDLGVLSRLASLNMLTVAGERIKLTKAGLDLANIVTKRKAA